MKKLYILLIGLLLNFSVFSQVPQKMSYQLVIRNASNSLVTNQPVGMQISIMQSTVTGISVYIETQTPTTNTNGLVSIEIGTGTVVSGDFTTIDWANDIYFIKTETDPTGGVSYTITGTSQLLSVPYALHAKTAESLTGTINYTETDPVFGVAVASGITAVDTANWNNHTIDTDTHIDSTGIAALDFVSGQHAVDTDTHIDSTEITALGFVSGSHLIDTDTHIDSVGIAALGFTTGPHSIDTDTHIDSTEIATLGFVVGQHTTDIDTHIDSTGITGLGFVSGSHTIDTDTHIDSIGIVTLGFASGQHILDTDTHIDSTGIAALGFTTGSHTIDTDTHIDSAGIIGLGFVSGQHTLDTDTQIDSTGIAALGFVAGPHSTNTYQIGDFVHGGIVFWLDETAQHGLVCNLTDLDDGSGLGAPWDLGFSLQYTGASGDGPFAGETNTSLIVLSTVFNSPGDNTLYAARMCNELFSSQGGDWYLPSKEELFTMYQNKSIINASAIANGGVAFNINNFYWSSTEDVANYTISWSCSFSTGSVSTNSKQFSGYVRPIRTF